MNHNTKMFKSFILSTFIYVTFCNTSVAADYSERDLGTLFTTPSERQKIDSSKRGDVTQTNSRRITPSSITINGMVIRSKGENTVWVNGDKSTGNKTSSGVKVLANSVSKNNKVRVLVDGKSVRIKPGQSWSEETEAVIDSY